MFINHCRYQRIHVFLFALLELAQKAHVIQSYICCYRHPSGPYFMLKEEYGKLQIFFVPQVDLQSKFSNVVNSIDLTRPPDNLAQILDFSISENLKLFRSINALYISYHKDSFNGKSNPNISAL